MENLLAQNLTEVSVDHDIISLSDRLEQDYRRYAHYLDGEVIG